MHNNTYHCIILNCLKYKLFYIYISVSVYADGYLMPDLHSYQQPEDNISRTSRTPDKKLKTESDRPCSKKNCSRRTENHEQKLMGSDQQQYDQEDTILENRQIRPTEEYIPVYSENAVAQNSFSAEETKIKKVTFQNNGFIPCVN